MTDALLFADVLGTTLNIIKVAVGLGLVIFFHELGHFAVAKWCDVFVERFSIGFGPVLWGFKKGETEYVISLIPFGGYVKMLGQDDMDPSQLTSEEIAQDPRSYSAKSVPQRMAIISAGVVMNVITGMLFYATAFGIGVKANPPTIGAVLPAKPAWTAGLRPGDEIVSINGRSMESYRDVQMAIVLSGGDVDVVIRRDGRELEPIALTPDGRGTRRIIGIRPPIGTTLVEPPPKDAALVTIPGMPAAAAKNPGFEPGDEIKRIDDVPIPDFATLQRVLAENRDKRVVFQVRRAGGSRELVKISVDHNPFRTLGLSMEIGEIVAVKKGSPAERMTLLNDEGKKSRQVALQAGDKITQFNELPIGKELNPLRLPDKFEKAARDRQLVRLKVQRKEWGDDPKVVTVQFGESDAVIPAWTEQPVVEDTPLSIPSLGVAFHMIPTVIHVEDDSPAKKAGLKQQDRLTKMTLSLPEGKTDGVNKNKPVDIEFGKKDNNGNLVHNWAYAFWTMQTLSTRTVEIAYVDKDGNPHTKEITPERSSNWFLPVRGIRPEATFIDLQASGPIDALRLGIKRARDSIVDVYMTIASLFGGRVSYKELSGPVGIFNTARKVAAQGFPDLLIFLGFLSINLAVLNFLPIPVLDGGHMVFLTWEAVTGKKPSERVMIASTYLGLAFILGLMGLVIYLDVFVNWGR
jgi:regulator of sigma E protease